MSNNKPGTMGIKAETYTKNENVKLCNLLFLEVRNLSTVMVSYSFGGMPVDLPIGGVRTITGLMGKVSGTLKLTIPQGGKIELIKAEL